MKKYIKRYKKENILLFLMIFMLSVITSAFAFIQMYIGRQVMAGKFRLVVLSCLGNAALSLGYHALNYVKKNYQARLIAKMNLNLRDDISDKISSLSYQELNQTDSGEYLSWYTNDVREAENRGFQEFYNYVSLIMELILGSVALIFIRVEILILTIATAFITLYAGKYFEKKVAKYSEKVSVAMERYTDRVKEQIMGIGITRAFGVSHRFYKEITASGQSLERERCDFVFRQGRENCKANWLAVLAINSINILTFILCTLRIIPPEVIFGSVNLTSQVGNATTEILGAKIRLAGAKPYFDKAEKVDAEDKENGKNPLPVLENGLRAEHLSFGYGEKEVLKDINFTFSKGGKYAIVGKSGNGKSTLLKLLLGQLTGYKGHIFYDGNEASAYDTDTFYRQMAYIEQSVFLFDTSIRENITLGDKFSEEEINRAIEMSSLKQALTSLPEGLETRVGENGRKLSGGQKQRVAVARALIHNRNILFVDEGTSALDKKNAEVIEQALLACPDLTLIIVTHHLKEENIPLYDGVYRL